MARGGHWNADINSLGQPFKKKERKEETERVVNVAPCHGLVFIHSPALSSICDDCCHHQSAESRRLSSRAISPPLTHVGARVVILKKNSSSLMVRVCFFSGYSSLAVGGSREYSTTWREGRNLKVLVFPEEITLVRIGLES